MKETKRNFYFKSQTGLNEAIEVYVGQSSGKQLGEDLANAKNEVLIISPYIDETKLDELIRLQKRNVNVRVAFSKLNKKQYKNILKKLIHQNKETDLAAKERREKQKNLFFFLAISTFTIAIVLLSSEIIKILHKGRSFIDLALILLSISLIYLTYRLWKKKDAVEKTEIYKYDYSEKLNFKYLRDNYGEKMFIHSKIYVIDRQIAYLGSLNFTNKGFTSNFETRVRITQKQKIEELVEFVHNIFDDDLNFKKHELFWLGQQVFTEEKY